MGIKDDSDWGHKPEDDDFKIEKGDIIDYMMNDVILSSYEWSEPYQIMSIPKDQCFQRGVKCMEIKNMVYARKEFRRGYEDYRCPYCATYYAMFIIDKVGETTSDSSFGRPSVNTLINLGITHDFKDANMLYGMCLANGLHGFPKDEDKAGKYIRRAAKQGHPLAIKVVEEFEKSRPSIWKSIGFGAKKATAETTSEIICEKLGNMVEGFISKLL